MTSLSVFPSSERVPVSSNVPRIFFAPSTDLIIDNADHRPPTPFEINARELEPPVRASLSFREQNDDHRRMRLHQELEILEGERLELQKNIRNSHQKLWEKDTRIANLRRVLDMAEDQTGRLRVTYEDGNVVESDYSVHYLIGPDLPARDMRQAGTSVGGCISPAMPVEEVDYAERERRRTPISLPVPDWDDHVDGNDDMNGHLILPSPIHSPDSSQHGDVVAGTGIDNNVDLVNRFMPASVLCPASEGDVCFVHHPLITPANYRNTGQLLAPDLYEHSIGEVISAAGIDPRQPPSSLATGACEEIIFDDRLQRANQVAPLPVPVPVPHVQQRVRRQPAMGHRLGGYQVDEAAHRIRVHCTCGKLYTSRDSLGTHVISMEFGKMFQCGQRGCQKSFRNLCQLREHLTSTLHFHHFFRSDRPEPTACGFCGRFFFNDAHRIAHIRVCQNRQIIRERVNNVI